MTATMTKKKTTTTVQAKPSKTANDTSGDTARGVRRAAKAASTKPVVKRTREQTSALKRLEAIATKLAKLKSEQDALVAERAQLWISTTKSGLSQAEVARASAMDPAAVCKLVAKANA